MQGQVRARCLGGASKNTPPQAAVFVQVSGPVSSHRMGEPVSWMQSVKCWVGRIGDPVSYTAQLSPWGLVQRRLPRLPPGDGTPFSFEEEAADNVGLLGQMVLLLSPSIR